MNIIYIHGFRSTGESGKAQQLRDFFPECKVISPTLSSCPSEAIKQLLLEIGDNRGCTVLVGTSLGGFYASFLACKYDMPAFIINPALEPQISLIKAVGAHKRYDSDQDYEFKVEYLTELKDIVAELKTLNKNVSNLNFYLSADDEQLTFEKLDELFPQRNSLKIYEDSGHRFSKFQEILPDINEIVKSQNALISDIKNRISLLAIQHSKTGDELEDWKDSDYIESQAEMLIVNYCEQKGYLVQGFPTEKRKNENDDDFDEDYFCQERYQLYLDTLLVTHDDVAELMWHYTSSFWKDTYTSKEDFTESVKGILDSGINDDFGF